MKIRFQFLSMLILLSVHSFAQQQNNIGSTGEVQIGILQPSSVPLWVFKDYGNSGSGNILQVGGKSWWTIGSWEGMQLGFSQLRSVYEGNNLWGFSLRTGLSDGIGIESMRISGTNKVGIGTSEPLAKLHVTSQGFGSNYLILEGSVSDNLNYPNVSFKGGALANTYPSVGLTNGGLALYLASGYHTSNYNFRSQINLQGADGSIDFLTGSGSVNSRMLINNFGNVLIGKSSQINAGYRLDVNGTIRANEVKVNTNGADFVFDKGYKLPTLSETEQFIAINKHLPEIPSAEEMKKNGLELGEMNIKLLQKVEELTLYLINQEKEISILKKQNDKIEGLRKENEHLPKVPSAKEMEKIVINLSEMNMLLLKKIKELTLHLIEKDKKINVLEGSNLEILSAIKSMKLELKEIKENLKTE